MALSSSFLHGIWRPFGMSFFLKRIEKVTRESLEKDHLGICHFVLLVINMLVLRNLRLLQFAMTITIGVCPHLPKNGL